MSWNEATMIFLDLFVSETVRLFYENFLTYKSDDLFVIPNKKFKVK